MLDNIQSHLFNELNDKPGEELRRLWRRASMQIAFARAFASVHAESHCGWPQLIDEAEKRIKQFDPSRGLAAFARCVADAEEAMSEIGQVAKEYCIHNVGHGHIDMNWMWSWPETVATTHDTFASVLELMRRYPDVTYSQSQTAVYALIERYHPAMFEEIQQRAREGRWEITASQWVEGDKNLSSGESLCRHLQISRSYFEDKFGLSPEDVPIDWEPDTFGHSVSLPGILVQGAVKYYYCCRTGGGFEHGQVGDARPQMFYWQSPDGSRVLVNRESTWYNAYLASGDNIALALVDFSRETGLHDWLNVYGVGNHGGGPTRASIDYLIELSGWPIYPTLEFSTANRYFKAVEAELAIGNVSLPILTNELNFEFTGCYTSQSLIKQANRFGENFLFEAEVLAAVASRLMGASYPSSLLDEAWRKVLFNQFHDILPGSGVRQTRDYALAQFQEVGAITGSIKREAIKLMTAQIDTASLVPATWAGAGEQDADGCQTSDGGHGIGALQTGLSASGGQGNRYRPYVVFNTCAWERSERVEVSVFDSGFDRSQIVAVADDGAIQPVLVLADSPCWGHNRLCVAFDARDVPATGYRTYLLCEKKNLPNADRVPEGQSGVETEDRDGFETPYVKFRVDRELGGVTELIDKRSGARIMPQSWREPSGTFQYVVEQTRGMEAWVLGRQLGEPLAMTPSSFRVLGRGGRGDTGSVSGIAPAGCQVEHFLRVPGTSSMIKLTQAIHGLEPRLDFTAEIDWREIGTQATGMPGLILTIPLGLKSITARYEIPFGSIERDRFAGDEVPSLRYAHIEGIARNAAGEEVFAGVTLLQDCKYGHSIVETDDGYVLRLRIVRSSFAPDAVPEVASTTIRYSVYLHDRPVDPAALARLGASWNHPLIANPVGIQRGDWPVKQGFVRVTTPGVVLSALKQAEHSAGLIVRLVELDGNDTEAVVELSPLIVRGLKSARLVDIMERPVEGSIEWAGHCLKVHIKAHQFATVLIDCD